MDEFFAIGSLVKTPGPAVPQQQQFVGGFALMRNYGFGRESAWPRDRQDRSEFPPGLNRKAIRCLLGFQRREIQARSYSLPIFMVVRSRAAGWAHPRMERLPDVPVLC